MYPNCRISVGGKDVDFGSQLISCEVVDKEGVSSDTINISIANADRRFSLPRKGVSIEAHMKGRSGSVFMGSFIAETVSASCFPHTIDVSGKAAAFQGFEKETSERHWDDATLREVISDLAGDMGLGVSIDPSLGSKFYTWIGQDNESPLAFLERMAKRHGALFSVKNGTLVFAARGAATSPSGLSLTGVSLGPSSIITNSCRFDFSDRTKYKTVKARFPDRAQGKKIEIEIESDGEGTASFRLGEQFADEAEARSAATAKAKDLKRKQIKFSVSVEGDPTIRAGAPVTFQDTLPEIDGQTFIVETARHSISPNGYVTSLDGHIQA